MARAATNRLGSELGKFEIIERLGAGGMGSVYLAYDPELDRRLAVKVLGGERAGSIAPGSTFDLRELSPELIAEPRTEVMSHRRTPPESNQALLVEARAMAQLSHPNVVSIYDVGSSDGQLFIAMELVEGANLREWLAKSGGRHPHAGRNSRLHCARAPRRRTSDANVRCLRLLRRARRGLGRRPARFTSRSS